MLIINKREFISESIIEALDELYVSGTYKEDQAQFTLNMYNSYCNVLKHQSATDYIEHYTTNLKVDAMTNLFFKDVVRILTDGGSTNLFKYKGLIERTYKNSNKVPPIVAAIRRNSATEFKVLIERLGIEQTLCLIDLMRRTRN